ncbi:hypothetical protein D3C81_1573850 [compost metagenome]
MLGQLVQRGDDAGDEVLGVAFLDGGAQPVGDHGAGRIGPDRAGDAKRHLDPLGDPAGDRSEEVHARQEVGAAHDIEGDLAALDAVGTDDDAAAVGSPLVGQFDRPPQAEPDAEGLRPDFVHRAAGPVDAIAAQLARRLGQFGQVQRDHAAALDAAAAGPVRQKGKAHGRGLAQGGRKCAAGTACHQVPLCRMLSDIVKSTYKSNAVGKRIQ